PPSGPAAGRRAGRGVWAEHAGDEPPPACAAPMRADRGGRGRSRRARAALSAAARAVRSPPDLADPGARVLGRAARHVQGARRAPRPRASLVSATDAVTVSIDVDVEPELAFAVFTRELDTWWGRGPRYRFLSPYQGTLVLEPGIGGRLLHVADAAAGRVFVVGAVEVWEPPHRLALSWRLPNFAPEQSTRASVRFEPVGQGTRVSVTHSGWDALSARHP